MSNPFYTSLLQSKAINQPFIYEIPTAPLKKHDFNSVEPMPESSAAELAAAMRASQGQTQRAWQSSWDYQKALASGNPEAIRAARATNRQAWETELRTKGWNFMGEVWPSFRPIKILIVVGLALLTLKILIKYRQGRKRTSNK
jgi:hypothetical protein